MKNYRFLALALLAISHSNATLAEEGKPKEEPPPVVFVIEAKKTELFDSLTYPARAVSKQKATLLAETDGVVTQIYAPLGKKVTRKQRLIQITHTDPVYRYAPVIMQAPITGVVSKLEVTEGTQVARGQELASLINPASTRLLIEAPAMDLVHLKEGLPGEFRVAGRTDTTQVSIVGISPMVDPATGTATCELDLKSSSKTAPPAPGLIGQVSFKANLRKGFTIPYDALIYRGKETFVRLVVDGKSKRVPVSVGRKQSGDVEILGGLKDGDVIIERTSKFVAEGQAVKVEQAGQAKAGEKGE